MSLFSSPRHSIVQALLVGAVALSTPTATCQTPEPLAFDSVSIRPSAPGGPLKSDTSENGFDATGLPLYNVVLTAWLPLPESYFRPDRLANAPAWLMKEPYDIHARFDAATAATLHTLTLKERDHRVALMLQTVLAERLHLQLELTSSETSVTYVRVARNGPKLQPASPDDRPPKGIDLGDGGVMKPFREADNTPAMQFFHISMPMLAVALSGFDAERAPAILDGTGIAGVYNFTLHRTDAAREHTDDPPAASLWDLSPYGLELKSGHGSLPLLKITHIDRPTPN